MTRIKKRQPGDRLAHYLICRPCAVVRGAFDPDDSKFFRSFCQYCGSEDAQIAPVTSFSWGPRPPLSSIDRQYSLRGDY